MFSQSTRYAVLAGALVALVSCASGTGQYDQLTADYQEGLASMEQANAAHAAMITAVVDLPAVCAEEGGHYDDMQTMMDDMMGTSQDLEQCGMMGSNDMTGIMDSMQQEMDTHRATMTGAGSMDEAMQEESAHQATMDEMFQSMEGMSEDMSGMMGTDMGCW